MTGYADCPTIRHRTDWCARMDAHQDHCDSCGRPITTEPTRLGSHTYHRDAHPADALAQLERRRRSEHAR